MGLFDSRETKERKSHFKNLILLALVDGDFDENERNFLIQTGINWGLSESQARSVVENPHSVKFVLAKEPDHRIVQLHDLIIMMLADGVIMEAEMDFVTTLAVKMGFRASDVPRMLESIIDAARQKAKPSIDATEFLDS